MPSERTTPGRKFSTITSAGRASFRKIPFPAAANASMRRSQEPRIMCRIDAGVFMTSGASTHR